MIILPAGTLSPPSASGAAVAGGSAPVTTILVVDDLKENRKYLVTVLKSRGYRVLEAANGAEGLASVVADRPDLVITDVLMPVMDGFELVKRLRPDPRISQTPVVFYTAHYGEREARELALTSGVSWVLSKPVASAMVLETVVRALSGESDTPVVPDAAERTVAFEREHLRLITDKLAEKTGNLRNANAKLRGLINIGLDLASEPDSGRLLKSVCLAARDLFGASYVTLGILDFNDRTVQRVIGCDADPARGAEALPWIAAGEPVPGILATVVTERRTIRGTNDGGMPATLQLPELHPDIHEYVVAPVASPDHVYGWICLVCNDGRSFTEEDGHLVEALSGQIGRIYENGLFHAAAQKKADEQRYLDSAEVIIVAVDTQARIRLINRYACAMLGRTAAELLGRDWVETCAPTASREALRLRLASLIGGDVSTVEGLMLTASGEERLIEWRPTLLRDDAGTVTGALSTGIDITDR